VPEIVTGEGIPAYRELGLHVSWRPMDHLRLSLAGQDLPRSRHIEFGAPAARGGIARGAYARLAR